MKLNKYKHLFKKITASTLCIVTAISCCGISASAANIKSVNRTLNYNYYDSIIKSWKVIAIKGNFKWAYNSKSKKLVNQTDISHSTPKLVIGCFAKNFKATKPIYDVKHKKGNGRLKLAWNAGVGISTQWITLGQNMTDYMGLDLIGDGSSKSFFS